MCFLVSSCRDSSGGDVPYPHVAHSGSLFPEQFPSWWCVTFIRRTGQDSRATSLGNMSIRLCGYNVTSEECTVIWKPCPRRTSRQGGIYHFHLYNKRTLPSNFLATFFFSSVTLPRVLAKPSADARSDVWVKNIYGPSSMRAGPIPFLSWSRKPWEQ